jgi:formate dehydrogenase assembly factor FdhD
MKKVWNYTEGKGEDFMLGYFIEKGVLKSQDKLRTVEIDKETLPSDVSYAKLIKTIKETFNIESTVLIVVK